MKYKLLKELPLADIGDDVEYFDDTTEIRRKGVCIAYLHKNLISEWLEPIVEKKTYDDLKLGDTVWVITTAGEIMISGFSNGYRRSEIFLTREEAEDELKRREWAARKDKFVPSENGIFYQYYPDDQSIDSKTNYMLSWDIHVINLGLAFRTREDCQDAIDNHDLIRLFYTIR